MQFEISVVARRLSLAFAGLTVLVGSPSIAQQPTPVAVTATAGEPPQRSDDQLDELDEVVVRGGRLYDLIVSAEDRFFKLYNELNKDNDFDTNCAFVPIDQDSRVEQRFCMPSFFADAKAEQVRFSQYCASLTERDEEDRIISQGACYEPPSAELVFFARRDAYVDNVIKITNSDPRLKSLADELDSLHREREGLARQYESIRSNSTSTRSETRRSRAER